MDGRAAEAMVPRSNSDSLQLRRVSGATLTGLMLSATAMDAGNRGKLGVALSGAVVGAETIKGTAAIEAEWMSPNQAAAKPSVGMNCYASHWCIRRLSRSDPEECSDCRSQTHRQSSPEGNTHYRCECRGTASARSQQAQQCKEEKGAACEPPHDCGIWEDQNQQEWKRSTRSESPGRSECSLDRLGRQRIGYAEFVPAMCTKRIMSHKLGGNT